MSFKRNQLISMPIRFPGVDSYVYKNCSIVKTTDPGVITISIAPHYGPALPKSETKSILSALGMDLSRPIHKSTTQHVGAPGMGNSVYYRQEVA